jgi:hypothetical protein
MPQEEALNSIKALDSTALVACPQASLRSHSVLAGQRRHYAVDNIDRD